MFYLSMCYLYSNFLHWFSNKFWCFFRPILSSDWFNNASCEIFCARVGGSYGREGGGWGGGGDGGEGEWVSEDWTGEAGGTIVNKHVNYN